MLKLRMVHQYLAVFFAPAILFFAFSGFFQTAGLHEVRGRPNYTPPHWIVVMASIHKDQRLPAAESDHHDADHHDDDHHDADHHDDDHDHHPPGGGNDSATWPLKFFVMCLSGGLIITTLMGLAVAWSNPRRRALTALLFIVGAALPVAFLFI